VLPRNLTKSRCLIGSFPSASSHRAGPALTQPSPPVIQGIFTPSSDKKGDRCGRCLAATAFYRPRGLCSKTSDLETF
jgi:hypothetical protein